MGTFLKPPDVIGENERDATGPGESAANATENDEHSLAARPFWEVLGTWEAAGLEQHELRYLQLKRTFGSDSAKRAELRVAIAAARRRCGYPVES